MATTPVIKISPDGLTAKGSWIDSGLTVLGPAIGITTPPYRGLPSIGRYAHDFVKEAGVWRIKHFSWTIYSSLPPFDFDPATAGPGWANARLQPGGASTPPWPPSPLDE